MANINIDCMIEHLVLGRKDYLTARVSPDNVVSFPEEVFDIFESVFAGEVAEDQIGHRVHNYQKI